MNKLEEKRMLETFLTTYCQGTTYKYIEDDNESPDFIIEMSNKKIGIEVTQIVDNGMKAIETVIANINQKVYVLLHERKLDTYIHVMPFYKKTANLLRIDRAAISNQIVDVICKNLPEDNSSIIIDNSENLNAIPNELYNIRIVNSKNFENHLVFPIDAGHVEEDFQKELQSILDKKEIKLAAYQKRYDDIWLLVITSGFNASSLYYPLNITKTHIYTSSYDRVIFFELFRKYYFDLKLIR